MPSLVFIGGAPGSGKTTVSRLLHERFQSVMIDFGTLREFHLDILWTKQSEKEEQMAFENLIFILKNYIRNGYKNVIVNDLKDFRIEQIPEVFADDDYLIVTLVLYDDDELRASSRSKQRQRLERCRESLRMESCSYRASGGQKRI